MGGSRSTRMGKQICSQTFISKIALGETTFGLMQKREVNIKMDQTLYEQEHNLSPLP